MKLIIAGSRHITDFVLFDECFMSSPFYTDYKYKLDSFELIPTEIVSGTAKGVDTLGEEYAKSKKIPIKRFKPDWEKYGKKAGIIRNTQMANYADALFYIWDGKSKGTKHMIDQAFMKGLHVWGVTTNIEY